MNYINEKINVTAHKFADYILITKQYICRRVELVEKYSVNQAPPFTLQKYSALKK